MDICRYLKHLFGIFCRYSGCTSLVGYVSNCVWVAVQCPVLQQMKTSHPKSLHFMLVIPGTDFKSSLKPDLANYGVWVRWGSLCHVHRHTNNFWQTNLLKKCINFWQNFLVRQRFYFGVKFLLLPETMSGAQFFSFF